MFDLKQLVRDRGDEALPLLREHVNPAFARVLRLLGYDVNFVRGRGAHLWDDQDRRYLDCLSGYGTFACGRGHPVIRQAVADAMDLELPNLPKMGVSKLSGLLAERLCGVAPAGMERVFFANSGAEAVESALKFSRAATGRSRLLCCEKGFHGLTLGALSVNGNADFREGFGSLIEPVTTIPFNDLEALERELSKGDVAGFIVEPIQGKGVRIPDDDYLPRAAELCRRHGTLLIADEIQTGLGRTGRMFACEHWGVEPDLITVAKALSGGYVPISAVLGRRWVFDRVFSSLERCVVHSTTFGQNDLAMAAGLATLSVLEEEDLVGNADRMGQRLMGLLRPLVAEFELVKEVRGRGLMVAIEFGPPTSWKLRMGWSMIHAADQGLFPQSILIPLLADHRVLAQVAGHHMDVIKLLPTLTIDEADAEHLESGLRQTIAACHQFPGPVWEIAKRLSGHALKGRSGAGAVAEGAR